MKFAVTAGHGGSDPGAVANGATEADLMAQLRNVLADKLRARGHKVRVDGTLLGNLPLVHALLLVPGSDAALELHTNAFTNPSARGVEVVAAPRHKARAQAIAQGIARVLETPVRGDMGWIPQERTARGRLGFVRAGGMVVETFFITNQEELAKYLARYYLVATAIADALEREL